MVWGKKARFKILTVNLPFAHIDLIEEMKQANLIVSRSEFVRAAVQEKLSRELELIKVTLDKYVEIPEFEEVYENPKQIIIDGKVWNKK